MVKFEILELFVNTLTSEKKYSFYEREKSQQAIQMHLSKEPKSFYEFLILFLECKSNFEYFFKKMKLIAQLYSILLTLKDLDT